MIKMFSLIEATILMSDKNKAAICTIAFTLHTELSRLNSRHASLNSKNALYPSILLIIVFKHGLL